MEKAYFDRAFDDIWTSALTNSLLEVTVISAGFLGSAITSSNGDM